MKSPPVRAPARALRGRLLPSILIYGLIATGLFVAMHWYASAIIYQGSASVPDPAWRDALKAEDVWLQARDGTRIHGWFVRSPGSMLATLFLHGNAGNVGNRALHIREIVAAGSDILVIDYRGYGRSKGRGPLAPLVLILAYNLNHHKLCPACRMRIDAQASKCPYCRTDVPVAAPPGQL